MAATRPPLTLGVPHTMFAWLLLGGVIPVMIVDTGDAVNDLIFDAIWAGTVLMIWSMAKIMLRADYHGWDIFISWLRLNARCLDTREWGGAHLSSLPLRSLYRCEVSSVH